MKRLVLIVTFFLSLLFLPDPLCAQDHPPLPVLKHGNPQNGPKSYKKTTKQGFVKRIKPNKSTFQSSKPLPEVDLPQAWKAKQKPFQKPKVKKGLGGPVLGKSVKIPLPQKRPEKSSPDKRILDEKEKPTLKAAMPLPPPLTKWSKKEILSARKKCQSLLKNIDVTVKPIKPIRFNACGTPAPLKVSAVSAVLSKKVSISPPATLNCAITARLAKWIETKLQPLAAKHLSSRVKMIHNAASYSCRNRYNNPNKKLSEHALANAFDIAGFTLENGQIVSVLKHWPEEVGQEKSAFLKAVHQSACKSFVVVLGPEANEAHKNHFHFDLGRYPVCE